ncbi:MAG TPA: c-type cytochrome biogenesis protein CcmI [Gammaproteobacteria bacterium]|nr:c-type cytochrome biogenesis protein CcmI [Gammaproteobacteria bacterium]
MTMFFFVAALLVAAALLFVIPPLWQARTRHSGVARDEANLEIIRDQLDELKADLGSGTLTQEQYDEARVELERRLLQDVSDEASTETAAASPSRAVAIGIMALVPVVAVIMYLVRGTPEAMDPEAVAKIEEQAQQAGHAVTRDQIEAMVQALADRLRNNPNDVEGWQMLGRSYMAMGNLPAAEQALEQALALVPNNPDILADYADVLALRNNRSLSGRPLQVVQRILELDPNHKKALWLAGTGAYDRGDYATALKYWERLQALAPPGSEEAQQVAGIVEEARSLLGQGAAPGVAAAAAGQVSGVVSISAELAGRVNPADVVFVFARAPQGGGMPLAILKARAKDLPMRFKLDDSQAMMPAARISNYTEVTVGARISRSGQAQAQSGDLEGRLSGVAVGSDDVDVVIDTVVP